MPFGGLDVRLRATVTRRQAAVQRAEARALTRPHVSAERRDIEARLTRFADLAAQARDENWSHEEYLAALLEGLPRLVCASAGNFGQGMAFAARKRELALTVFAAVIVPSPVR